MKILITTDIHSGTTRESSTHPGHKRQASSGAVDTIRQLSDSWQSMNFDHAYSLGDYIKPLRDVTQNQVLFEEIVKVIKETQVETTFLYGNHDIEKIAIAKMREVCGQAEFFGIHERDGWQILCLDHEQVDEKTAILSQERIERIKNNLKQEMPTIVMSHYALGAIDIRNNFLFDGAGEATVYRNTQEIVELLSSYNVRLAINGHSHWASYKKAKPFSIVGIAPFSENFLISCDSDKNPGIYTVLETVGEKIILKTYSGEFCFLNIEI